MEQFARFMLKAALFTIVFFLCDRLIGFTMDRLMGSLPDTGNEVSHVYYSFNKTKAPILVVGSSRARHHYDPRVIVDSLGLDAFNTGLDGYFLSYQCALINSVLERYSPKVIIWECGSNCLYEQDKDPVHSLYPYYHKEGVKVIVDAKEGSLMRYKMLSECYRYNDACLPSLIRFVESKYYSIKDDPNKGFVIRNKQIDPDYPLHISDICEGGLSEQKEELFTKTIDKILSHGVCLVIVDSPLYELPNDNNLSQEHIKFICQQKNVPYYDNRYLYASKDFSWKFCDHNHLNTDGAIQYTKDFIRVIK